MLHHTKENTMEEFFIIPNRKLDSANWELNDLHDDYNALEYCVQLLDVPEEHLEYATLGSEGLEVNLIDLNLEELKQDSDWYMQLKRVSNFNRIAS